MLLAVHSHSNYSMGRIESVDLGALIQHEEHEEETIVEISQHLAKSLRTIGFVYLLNHGIDEETIIQAMEASAEYFKLDDTIKKADTIGHGPEFQGWVSQGREVFDQDEVF